MDKNHCESHQINRKAAGKKPVLFGNGRSRTAAVVAAAAAAPQFYNWLP